MRIPAALRRRSSYGRTRVPFVNPYADAPTLPEGEAIDPRTLFEEKGAPIELEIGPGRGTFILGRLAAAPDVRMLGFEIRRKWASIVDGRIRDSANARSSGNDEFR